MKKCLLVFYVCSNLVSGLFSEEAPMTGLYNSLNPQSIAQLFAFYSLYPNTPLGKQAGADGWKLLYKHRDVPCECDANLTLPEIELKEIIDLVYSESFEKQISLSEVELEKIEKISSHLANRTLKGHLVWNKEELLNLSPEETDLGRSVLVTQFETNRLRIRQYEAILDIMALQILAYLPIEATELEKIEAINHFIFHEKRFRFPPHSLWAKEIDIYTFLPLVLDNRLGVCLGLSILYLSIADRLSLPLEILTPPGHIFLRYRMGTETINIETTARGIHLPDETYLGINTCFFQQRTKQEVIGLVLMNQASVFWQQERYQESVALYEKALPFLPKDPFLKTLLAYNYLLIGKDKQGKRLLNEVKHDLPEYAISRETTPEDFLSGAVNLQGIQTIFLHVDETMESILNKQTKLEEVLKQCPRFREGILQLGMTYLQLGRKKEALDVLNRYHAISPNSPIVEYYLAILCMHRFLYQEAWNHLSRVETLTKHRTHFSEPLTHLRQALQLLYPKPQKDSQ